MELNVQAVKQDLKSFHQKSDFQGVWALFRQYFALLLMGCIIFIMYENLPLFVFLPLYIPLGIIQAGNLWGFYPLMHEAIHFNLFKTKRINNWIGILGTYLIFEDVLLYKKNHKVHHNHLCTEKDSEEELKIRWGVSTNISFFDLYIKRFFSLYYAKDFFVHSVIPFFYTNKHSFAKYIYWVILIFISIYYVFSVVIFIYCIPVFIFYPYINFLSVVHEHLLVENKSELSEKNTIPFSCTRNNVKGVLNKYILHPFNDGYHAIHHFDSAIPFYKLPAAHELVKNKYNISLVEESFGETISKIYTQKIKNNEEKLY